MKPFDIDELDRLYVAATEVPTRLNRMVIAERKPKFRRALHNAWPALSARLRELETREYPGEDIKRLVRELDVIWNGESGAAKQASLCDIVSQFAQEVPLLRAELEAVKRERDAYKRAKQENDDRFMTERDALRTENDKLRSEVERLRDAGKTLVETSDRFFKSARENHQRAECLENELAKARAVIQQTPRLAELAPVLEELSTQLRIVANTVEASDD